MKDNRYIRQLSLPGFGSEAQEKLTKARILIIGAGGLGTPAALYLAGVGIGHLTIVDSDKVELTNLHRQPIYKTEDVGKLKAELLTKHLKELNPRLEIEGVVSRFNLSNAIELVSKADLVLDCSDNFTTRYLINDTCVRLNKAFISAAVYRFEGQFGIFNYNNGPTYRCFAPAPPRNENELSCNEVGVLGTLPGIMGLMQATEAIKIITDSSYIQNNKIFIFSTLDYSISNYKLDRNESLVQKITNGDFEHELYQNVEIEWEDLSNLNDKTNYKFIDIREVGEQPVFDASELLLLPLSEDIAIPKEINHDNVYICFCQSGIRSIAAAKQLREAGYEAYSLRKGIEPLLENNVFPIKHLESI